MEDYLNNRQKEILLRLLANPADTGASYLSNLQEMVKIHPRSGLLRALYGRALNEPAPHVASGYFDSSALHKLLYRHDNLTPIANEQVAMQPDGALFGQPLTIPEDEPHFVTPEQLADIDTTIYADRPADNPVAFQNDIEDHQQEIVKDLVEPPALPIEETLPADGSTIIEDFTTPPPIPEQELLTQGEEPAVLTPFELAPWEVSSTTKEQSLTEPAPSEIPSATPEQPTDEEPLGRAPWEMDDEDEEDEQPLAVTTTPIDLPTEQRYGWEVPLNDTIIEAEPEAGTPLTESRWQTEEVTAPVETNTIDDEMAAKLAYWASLEDEYDAPQAVAPIAEQASFIEPDPVAAQESVNYFHQDTPIHDEVYDEITSIEDIGLAQMAVESAYQAQEAPAAEALTELQEAPVAEAVVADTVAETYEAPAEASQPAKPADEERLILGNIAATDYFRFDKAFGESADRDTEPAPAPVAEPLPVAQAAPVAEEPQQDVSMYHDEKMPYSFMWWLDKTRMEHSNLYQPYAKAPVDRTATGEVQKPSGDALQQQYVENIFHLNTEGLVAEDAKTVEFDMQRKEDLIIQRFIEQDPHIHPPVGEKLDTENKAKKSSEDDLEMVTETLARIYADQMLFPKAIATYKKLILKYPEKSRYFASRIENLEKRTN